MKVLVTGALGFVGSNLCRHFSEKMGAQVFGTDSRYKLNGSDKNLELIQSSGVTFLNCDIRNQDDVRRLFTENGPFDCIYHMAAQVAFKVSVESPRLDFEINALGTFNLLEALRTLSPDALFVYASTNQVYGELNDVPVTEYETRFDFSENLKGITESHRLDFLSPYGCSKGAGDMYTQDYGRVYNLNTVVTRFGGIYGPQQYSYEDHGWISYIADQVRQNRAFNRFGHGKQVRDVLFIDDIVSAMHRLYDLRSQIKRGACYNIGGGKQNSLSVLELLTILEELTGNQEKSIINPMRKADKLVVYLDISKASKDLGWEPTVSYREGIQRLIDWQNCQ
jgi:CDP-paratose 2-epimerase